MCFGATATVKNTKHQSKIMPSSPSSSPTEETSDTSLSSNSSVDSASSGEAETAAAEELNAMRHELHCEKVSEVAGKDTTSTRAAASANSRKLIKRSSSFHETGFHLTAGTLVSGIVVVFSLYFPFLLDPQAALQTYHFAFWKYNQDQSLFDNSVWTYGTDYFLAVSMLMLVLCIPSRAPIAGHARGLVACYLLSVTAGGVAHQWYETVESRNTASFRLLWRICVGTVAAASGFMGATATELFRIDQARGVRIVLPELWGKSLAVPVIPNSFWLGYAIFTVLIVIAGGFSFQRPACDIFIVGITQFPSTFYMMLVLAAGLPDFRVSKASRFAGCCGFILNAPLLPLYPVLVVRLGWSLPSVNTLLHMWLLVAWSLQGLSLRHAGKAVMAKEQQEETTHIKTTTQKESLLKMD